MENSIVFRDEGYTIYRNYYGRSFWYTVYRNIKVGEFTSIDRAKRACKEKNKDWEKFKLMMLGAAISWIPLALKMALDFISK